MPKLDLAESFHQLAAAFDDVLDIKTWAPGDDPEGDPTERAGGVLRGGNIVVHTK